MVGFKFQEDPVVILAVQITFGKNLFDLCYSFGIVGIFLKLGMQRASPSKYFGETGWFIDETIYPGLLSG
jgi:hypothetical protein